MRERSYRIIYLSAIAALFIYVILRAFFVMPLFDESASYFHYFMSGNIWNDRAVLDANNHLLVSFAAHFWYSLGIDHFFFFRLLSVIGFIGYVAAWHRLVFNYLSLRWKHFTVLCCISVPWIVEYAALARGYAFSMGTWFWMIVLLIEITRNYSGWKILLFFLLGWLSMFSCLAFTIPVILLVGMLLVHAGFTFRKKALSDKLMYVIGTLLFLLAYLPLYKHSMRLKEAGLLWWGSKDGLWEVTGTSISKEVLFSESSYIQGVLYAILALSAFLVIRRLVRLKPSEWFVNPFNWIIAYTIGLLVALVAFTKLLGMNYPMDRVGMYLVPLFLLLVIHAFSAVSRARFGLFLLLFFPLSLFFHMNLHTTLFSPQDRISENTYEGMRQLLKDDSQVGADWMPFLMLNQAVRRNHDRLIITYLFDDFPKNTDYLILGYRAKNDPPEGFREVYYDSIADLALYKKQVPNAHHVFDILTFSSEWTTELSCEIAVKDSSYWGDGSFSFRLEGRFELERPAEELKLHVYYTDSTGAEHTLLHNNLHHLFSPRTNFECIINSNTFPPVPAKEIRFRIENPGGIRMQTPYLKIYLLKD